VLERIAYRPLRNAPRLVPLISAIGASITLQQLFLRLFGSGTRVYPNLNLYVLPATCVEQTSEGQCLGIDLIQGSYPVEIAGLNLQIRPLYFIIFFLALLFMSILWYIVQRTKTGRAMRAVAEDKPTAALMGVNVDRVILITFLLGAALAGAAAVLFALYNTQVTPFMGFTPGIKAFTAAVLGGIGNIPGAMAGGLLLGMLESVAPALLGLQTQLQDVIAFGVLVLILIFRPTGIFGEVLSKKKA
jgi:branched-chain amino acid transport system permease protein